MVIPKGCSGGHGREAVVRGEHQTVRKSTPSSGRQRRLRQGPGWRLTGVVVSLVCAPLCHAGGRVDSVETAPSPASSKSDATPLPPHRPTGARQRVQVRGEWFYVDGEPFLVKGIGYSPSRPGQVPWRDRVDATLMERDFQRIVQAGFNTLRTWSPLSPEALALAERYGLMVLQGIWVERSGNYASEAFRAQVLKTIAAEVERARAHANVLAFLVGNELLPERVFQTGVTEIETLLTQVAQELRRTDATRLASYANWPSLSFLNSSIWDAICFNLYPYEPSSVAHTFGFRGYVEHLKRTVARGKPLVITEVGLSVSPVAAPKAGYGGFTPEAQRRELLTLWDELFQAGAQGGAIFEWNDEWWKQQGSPDDALTHDPADPEEWFGLVEFPSAEQVEGRPRPVVEALTTYNQAILLSPVSGEPYQGRIPVTVYATEAVAQVRVRVDEGKWRAATKLNRHWWKVFLPLDPHTSVGEHRLLMEAYGAKRQLLVRRERAISLGPPLPVPQVSIQTDRSLYDVGKALEPVHYTITVTDAAGQPLANQPVSWSITEPQARADLTQAKGTDGQGRIEGSYLVHEPGLVTFAAATPLNGISPQRRIGAETFVVVRHVPSLSHQPSPWEANLPDELTKALRHEQPVFQLANPGRERIVDYERYGRFLDVGTPAYRYEVTDWAGLALAVGEGIYPNVAGLLNDPAYQAAKKAGRLDGSHWDFIFLEDPQRSFLKWADAEEEPGVKQFYTALTLERAGLWFHAVKAYDAVLVHFPTSIGWTAFDPPTPWYVGKVARDKIEAILRLHPELGMRLEGAQIIVEHGFDNDVDNDTILANPGRLVPVAPAEVNRPSLDVSTLAVTRKVGKGRVQLVRYENGHWQLMVDGKPWVIRGMTYAPSAVGESHDEGTVKDWMIADRNGNGKLDGPFEAFVDANGNNRQDPEEPAVGDFQLLNDLGVNTIRLYHHASTPTLLRQLYEQYGIMVLMGDLVGMYTVGSGASWEAGTDYLDAKQRKRMFEGVKQMVREFKDEPYILMWVLGNENNYGGVHGIVGGVGNAGRYPEVYYGFLNELAQWIHQEDPHHPVAIANGDLGFLDVMAKAAPAIDVFGTNAYRGWHGFGRSLFEEVQRYVDKPVLITEYGCPAYQIGQPHQVAERDQALYHFGSWVDIMDNRAGRGVGNAIGGVVFEWSDEWWKAGQPPRFSPSVQETQPNWAGPFPGGWNFEEWFGLAGQGDGHLSPFLRQLRLSYRLYQRLWNPERPQSTVHSPQ